MKTIGGLIKTPQGLMNCEEKKDFDFWCLKEMVESVIYSDCAAAVTTTKTQAARGAKNTCNSEVLPGWGQVVMALNNIPKRWTMPV